MPRDRSFPAVAADLDSPQPRKAVASMLEEPRPRCTVPRAADRLRSPALVVIEHVKRHLAWKPGAFEAGEGARTLDIQLGRLTLYQLSYTRKSLLIGQGQVI